MSTLLAISRAIDFVNTKLGKIVAWLLVRRRRGLDYQCDRS
jgi:TRAP-type mannitol/chloroaromatic compound transport system permease small subunit